MPHIRMETHIEAPVEHVWESWCDGSNWDELQPRAKHTDFSGPLDRVGTTYVERMRFMGYEMKMTFEIVEVEPLRLIHERSEWQENHFRFEPDGDATNFIVDTDVEMPGKMPGFIKDMLSKGMGERTMRNVLADFKALAEAKAPAKA